MNLPRQIFFRFSSSRVSHSKQQPNKQPTSNINQQQHPSDNLPTLSLLFEPRCKMMIRTFLHTSGRSGCGRTCCSSGGSRPGGNEMIISIRPLLLPVRRSICFTATNTKRQPTSPPPQPLATPQSSVRRKVITRRNFWWSSSSSDNSNPSSSYSRHGGIVMHPDSIGNDILPGNRVLMADQKTTRPTEFGHGTFWMLKDLRRTNDKPVLSNLTLIPPDKAAVFPPLAGLSTLADSDNDDSTSGEINLPERFIQLRDNRSQSCNTNTTLVTVSFRDYGHTLLDSWIEPYEKAFPASSSRTEIIRLNLCEGWLFTTRLLRNYIRNQMKHNTPASIQGKTLVKFDTADNLEPFRDSLRMHNSMTGYVYLLDGLAKVRFAGSGTASSEEVQRLITFTKQILNDTHRSNVNHDRTSESITRTSSGNGRHNTKRKNKKSKQRH